MTQTEPPPSLFEKQVRYQVYAQFVALGRAPTTEEVAQALSCSLSEVQAAYQQLAAGKALVLQESGEVLMAEPFSAVPTSFTVEIGNRSWWGNCIWDALGIPAMLMQDARVITSCGCCNAAMTLEVRDGRLQQLYAGVVHFALPPRIWWNDVIFA
jgi:DNA-binding transcriptional MocR family regulator